MNGMVPAPFHNWRIAARFQYRGRGCFQDCILQALAGILLFNPKSGRKLSIVDNFSWRKSHKVHRESKERVSQKVKKNLHREDAKTQRIENQ
jgi:hypothetical protein